MVFYLGNKVEGLVADKVRNLRTKLNHGLMDITKQLIRLSSLKMELLEKYTVLKGLILDFLKSLTIVK
jgi:hypothetical protein